MDNSVVSASVPGKVLACGGYAILKRPNRGLVLATTARFTTTVKWCKWDAASFGKNADYAHAVVCSPQFDAVYEYLVSRTADDHYCVKQKDSASERNVYVEATLAASLQAARAASGGAVWEHLSRASKASEALRLDLLADNDFYSQQARLKSQGLAFTCENLRKIPSGASALDESGSLAKTGLGSSAALITSMVASMLHFFADPEKDQVHRYAQIVHALVQGKIGSGFDVYAASFGSSIYSRYSPKAIQGAMASLSTEEPGNGSATRSPPLKPLRECVASDDAWDYCGMPMRLPSKIQLMCGDVATGSATPSMSRKILAWKERSDGGMPALWKELLECNERVISAVAALNEFCRSDPEAYSRIADACAESPARSWASADDTVGPGFVSLRKSISDARKCLKSIGVEAQVPVEPDPQTRLCNDTMEITGVIACGVPGAGGYDAIFAFVLGDKARKNVEAFWSSQSVCPLLLSEERETDGIVISRGVDEAR